MLFIPLRTPSRSLITLGVTLFLSGLLACASAKGGGGGGGEEGEDLLFTEVDLAGSGADLSGGGADLSSGGQDLSMSTQDLSMTLSQDLSMPPADMRMTASQDLLTPPDLMAITGCSIVPQGGCPTGQKCTTHDAKTSICDPNGTVARAKSCTYMGDLDDCAAANICIVESMTVNQCRRFCKADGDCANTRSFCDFDLDTMGGGASIVKVCTEPCNAIYPGAGCGAGLACKVYGREHTDCQAAGSGGLNMPCGDALDCQGGLACIGPAGATVCRKVCPKGNSTSCGSGNTCFNVQSGTFVWPLYGVCCPSGAGC